MSTISSNMSLIIPSVGSTPGPDYAFDINSSLTLIDLHDHSTGKGVQITPAGLNINVDLSFQDNSAIDLASIVLNSQSSASTTPQSISVAPGGESPQQQDLFYTPDTGIPIQITKNGAVNATAASIPGESYAAGTFFWTQEQDALPTTPANFDIGSIILRPNVALTAFGVRLQPAAGISSQYSINLPLLPVSQKIMTLDESGNMTAPYVVDNSTIEVPANTIQVKNQGITAAKIQNNTITTNQISLTAGITQQQLAADAFEWTVETFLTSDTVDVPDGCNLAFIVGSGGGGGGGSGKNGGGNATGGGGGAGATPMEKFQSVTPGQTLTVTIGTGGAGGAANGTTGQSNPGTNGTASTITGTGVDLYFPGALGAEGGATGGDRGDDWTVSFSGLPVGLGSDGSLQGGSVSSANRTLLVSTAQSSGTSTAGAGGGGAGGAGWSIGGAGGNGGANAGVAGGTAAANTGAGGGGGGARQNAGGGGAGAGGSAGSGKVVIYWLFGGS